jgi:hypothetical protein
VGLLVSSQVKLVLSPKQRAKPKTSARKTGFSESKRGTFLGIIYFNAILAGIFTEKETASPEPHDARGTEEIHEKNAQAFLLLLCSFSN